MIFHHGDHSVLHVLLFGREGGGRVFLLELGSQLLDDKVRIANLLPVELDEGQETPL